jgi:RimJ/RimL family protein N-acetyltransferase
VPNEKATFAAAAPTPAPVYPASIRNSQAAAHSPPYIQGMFLPLRTDRLVIRSFAAEDAQGLWERRNDPEVARYQNWVVPFPREAAEALVEELLVMDGPTDGEWWMAIVADAASGEVYGDLALHLGSQGRIAEVGYTFGVRHWGKGYAAEAVQGLVDHLFDQVGVTRVFGMLHPDNRSSAMLLERVGFVFEGHTRLSFWLGDENSDDHIYGLIRSDWEAWRSRLRTPPSDLRLVPVTLDNERAVLGLRTHKTQEAFVAPMLYSFADALFPEVVDLAPVVPWMRAIEADGKVVGFIMVALTTEHHPEPFLWRLLIDRMHQRRGVASRALDLLEHELRAMGDTTMLVSWVEGKGSPDRFYLARGFEPTGAIVDGEIEARKRLV